MKEYTWPIAAFLILIAITLSGGAKNYQSGVEQQNTVNQPSNPVFSVNTDISSGLIDKTNKITMYSGSYGSNSADQEYIELVADEQNTKSINITGFSLVSTSTGARATIPQNVALYFTNSNNATEDTYLAPGERAYIITGRSPITHGFHVNICTGYLNQFYTFSPSIYSACPAPRNEDLSSIPRTFNNNKCFDLIDTLSSCQRYTGQPLNNSYSYECQQFIATKLNYQSCVDTHKDDATFWSPKRWYIYLRHDSPLWQSRRETILLQDKTGKTLAKIVRQ